jgi:hypothetical protein
MGLQLRVKKYDLGVGTIRRPHKAQEIAETTIQVLYRAPPQVLGCETLIEIIPEVNKGFPVSLFSMTLNSRVQVLHQTFLEVFPDHSTRSLSICSLLIPKQLPVYNSRLNQPVWAPPGTITWVKSHIIEPPDKGMDATASCDTMRQPFQASTQHDQR